MPDRGTDRYPVSIHTGERITVADSLQLRERTLVVLKPDAVVRGLAGRIIARFEDAALKVIGMKMREIDADFARKDAVATVRKIVGTTYPNEAQPGSIRGDFAHQSKAVAGATGKAVANLVHASGNKEEAQYEVNLWFDKTELFEYKTIAEAFDW